VGCVQTRVEEDSHAWHDCDHVLDLVHEIIDGLAQPR
jgi:hypothetical protein